VGTVLVVDGSDVCRAPIVECTLREQLSNTAWATATTVVSRGLTAERGSTMCDSAASRLGFTGPAIAFYGAHRAEPLTVADIAGADLVLTAERAQRSAIVRMLPGTQATVFTWKEALALATVLVDRRRIAALAAPADLAALARALHSARGAVPLIEPTVRTGAFHWRRATETDPLTIPSGHEGRPEHRRITQESLTVAESLMSRIVALIRPHAPEIGLDERRLPSRWAVRSA
jgi:protein-tyrosine phosphatase